MRTPSRKTAKQTRGSRQGSVCGSRTETMQKNLALAGGRTS